MAQTKQPLNPPLPPPPPTRTNNHAYDPQTLASTLSLILQQYSSTLPATNTPHVHPRLITFPDGTSKANWRRSLPADDISHRDTYAAWGRSPKQSSTNCNIGVFSTWTRSTIGDREWDRRPWHVWGVAILKPKRGQGKYIIIWDCDPRSPYRERGGCDTVIRGKREGEMKRPHEFLLPVQYKLLNYLRGKRKVRVLGLFYHADSRFAGQGRCLDFTMGWVGRMVKYGDEPFRGLDGEGKSLDPRTEGCVRIKRL